MAGITIRGLSKSFGARDASFAAVADLDLEIKDNSFVTLLGPSGCGKTTTLRLIAGYIVPDTGTIEVDGRVLSSPGAVVPPEARGMGMVFQNYAVWPHKTVFENVVFGLKLRKVPRRRGEEAGRDGACAGQSVGPRRRAIPNELCGGQQQRVALARSLVVEPSILLLDEPLSNLDAKLRERMRTELKELQRRTGITFVYVTHDQAEALALSDHIAVMQRRAAAAIRHAVRGLCASGQPHRRRFHGTGESGAGQGARARERAAARSSSRPTSRSMSPRWTACKPGEQVDVAIRPENIRLARVLAAAPPRQRWRRSPTRCSSATSANITRRCRAARCCACRPTRCSNSRSGKRSRSRSMPRNAASSAARSGDTT